MNRLFSALLCLFALYAGSLCGGEAEARRAQATKAAGAGNFKDAWEIYSQLTLDPKADPIQVGADLQNAVSALQQLGRYNETDDFREKAVAVHATNWRLLHATALSISQDQHQGFMVAGKFLRGNNRGGGEYVSAFERDRIRGLQLMKQAMAAAQSEKTPNARADFYQSFAEFIVTQSYGQTWRLQVLSDLTVLPDYVPGYQNYGGEQRGAPVDAEGKPLFYKLPKSFDEAANDGERWRWALLQVVENNAARMGYVRYTFATFLQQQFDARSMAGFGMPSADPKEGESGPYALHTLGEDETIARLATGIKRFKLPDEYNFIKILQQAANENKDYAPQALESLAQTFEDRQQYDKAAQHWQRAITEYGDAGGSRSLRLKQIVGNWGKFENVEVQPATDRLAVVPPAPGEPHKADGATVEFRFRNAKKVSFTANEIDVSKLLAEVKAHIKAKPAQLDWQMLDISNIGYRIMLQKQQQYVGKQVAAWEQEIRPREKHFDRRVTISTPLQKAGAYLLTAKLQDGNTSSIIIWVADLALIKKQMDKRPYYFVADAITGAPVPGAKMEFFGYSQRHVKDNTYAIDTAEFSETTDADGQLIPAAERIPNNYQWLVIATSADGRVAYSGFTHIWHGNYTDTPYNQRKVFGITDRPAYRPDQSVKFKFWLNNVKYDAEGSSPFAGQNFTVQVNNPKGEKIFEKSYKADEFGGLDGELILGKEATLGTYTIQIVKQWPGITFRLEEYKKPEFEVKIDAPTEPVMLGEKVTATISAKYYFGTPVTEAKVKYKVQRFNHTARWFPAGQWDWFYNPGYWWFAQDYDWYPGFKQWGCRRPSPWWWGSRQDPPELVMENEVAIGADGTVKVEIDTAVAKAMHGDLDHRYQISAEVVDNSRRVITGQGSVMVARSPFKVYTWVDRGYYRTNDVVQVDISAQTLDNKPVKGSGALKLLKITYDKDGKPVEKVIQEQALDCDEQGKARLQLKAGEKGQYRVSYTLTDAQKHAIEGGYVFSVIGDGMVESADFRFNNIELIADKREYAPGEKVKLMINSNREGGTVVLFARPSNGMYLPPKVIRMKGKSIVEEIDVAKNDMPNFFVEAFTISGAKYYSETREIVVPPESRVLNVEVKPSAVQYKPGEKAKVQLKVTDSTGQPFSGSMAVTLYDKAIEYISGGSNVQEIRSFFWKWRRQHREQAENTLLKWSTNLVRNNDQAMAFLGAFGHMAAELGEGGGDVAGGGGIGRGEMRKAGAAAPASPMPVASARASNGMGADGAMAGADKPQRGLQMEEKLKSESASGPESQNEMVEPTVRKNFADSAYWNAALTTDKSGSVEIEIPMPENLSTWKLKVWSMGQGARVGEASTEVVTSKNLIVRLQAPRFFTQKDEVLLSANVHNYLKEKKTIQVTLELDGGCLEAADAGLLKQSIIVEPSGEKRVDWLVKVSSPGQPIVRVKALSDEESDAMQMTFPAYIHGMMKTDSIAGAIRPDKESATFTLNVPRERRVEDSALEIRYSPTLAGAMVDALPYLSEYPYGCTEQTLSRFLPTVLTQKVLMRMNLNLKDVKAKLTNLNAQEIGDDATRSKQWNRGNNPVFDEAEVAERVKAGVQRLASMQVGDGGWGWFSGAGERSYAHTTAHVVHGLQIARANDVKLPKEMLERGVQWLKNYQAQQMSMIKNAPAKTQPYKEKADNLDAFVYMVLTDAKIADKEMQEQLYRDRIGLAVYSKAMFGLALQKLGEKEKLDMIVKNIEQFLQQDEENQTAWLKLPEDNHWWYWYGSEYEAQAYYLKLLSATDPKGEKASRLVKYLINNRKHASYWNSTRDTAICVEAMAEYLTASGEDGPDMQLEVLINGKKVKDVAINASNLFTFDNRVFITGKNVTDGEHKIELKKKGKGPLYFNAYISNFTLEDNITRAGLEIKVDRKFYKLNRADKVEAVQGVRGQAVGQKVEKYEREELKNLATLKSGDLVEIELEIDSKNDYEYILFEDMKAAGFEPVDVRSGYTGRGMNAYMELRDERVCFFMRSLARGKQSVSYRMRAEIPGKFSALPTRAYAMYAPELKANSDEIKLRIKD